MSRARPLARLQPGRLLAALVATALAGCATKDDVALSKTELAEIPKIPVPPEHGPKLASIADLTPVYERPAANAKRLGYLHAGARVARAEQAYTRDGCPDGWFPVRPAGFVCATGSATVDLNHPTLAAMAIQPLLDQALPYTYARTTSETALYERDIGHDGAVREVGKLKKRAGMAVVGSWTAAVADGKSERLALLTSGKFVKAADLEAAKPGQFAGVALGAKQELPLAFVVKRGVRLWKLEGDEARQDRELEVHEHLPLTGKFRTVHGDKFWATEKERWVRHKDATVVLARSAFPDFATDGQKWLDVSTVMGTLVAYEGKKPFFVTLVSVARNPATAAPEAALDDTPPSPAAPAGLGTFEVVAKHVTLVGADPFTPRENFQVYDVPWALELSSGRLIYGAYWHERFGVEHGPGSVELAPADAVRLFQWATPSVPDGWHGTSTPGNDPKTLVVLRK
ncbi:MAG TPA: L,D-transpeptidase [Polyangiaceae bacterium]